MGTLVTGKPINASAQKEANAIFQQMFAQRWGQKPAEIVETIPSPFLTCQMGVSEQIILAHSSSNPLPQCLNVSRGNYSKTEMNLRCAEGSFWKFFYDYKKVQ